MERRHAWILLAVGTLVVIAALFTAPEPRTAPAEHVVIPTAAYATADPVGAARRDPLVPARRDVYSAPVGTRLRFALQLESAVRLGDAQEGAVAFDGAFEVVVAQRAAGELVLAARLLDARVATRGARTDAEHETGLAAALGEVALVRCSLDGDTLGLRFPGTMTAEHRNWMRTLVSAFRFVVPVEHGAAWSTTEVDTTGRASLDYAVRRDEGLDLEITRVRTGYDEPPGAAPSGSARARFDRSLGWAVEIVVAEQLVVPIAELDATVTSHVTGSMRLTHRARGDAPPVPPGTWEEIDGRADTIAAARAQREIVHVDADAVLESLRRLAGADPVDLLALDESLGLLARALASRAALVARLELTLDDPWLDPAFAGLLYAALAQAGTDAAQQALARRIAAPATTETHRVVALEAMFGLPHAGPEVAAALRACLTPELTPTSATATLLVGALAGRGGSSTNGLLDALTASEPARGSAELQVWLEAVGNAGNEVLLGRALAHASHRDPAVRAAAATALRKMHGSEAHDALVAALSDAEPIVRARAIEALAERDAPPTALLARAARSDVHPDVRRSALLGLVARCGTEVADVRELLDLVAASDPDPELRALAREFATS